jgi:hypothetical protein
MDDVIERIKAVREELTNVGVFAAELGGEEDWISIWTH